MFKSIITTALRNMFRNRSFSLINIIGLSASMSLALLVILLIREQYTYDDFHRDSERIFRVSTKALRTSGGSEDYASTPAPIGRVFLEDYAFAEEVVRVNRSLRADAVFDNVNVPVSGLFVDPSFLRVFNFPLEKGNPASALSDPRGVVLTQEASKKIFGDREPLGKTITLPQFGDFTVTGVLGELISKTHFEFEILGSMNAIPVLEQQGVVRATLDSWNDYYANYVYFKLKAGKEVTEAERALVDINRKYYADLPLETRDRGYEFFVMPLNEITPGPAMSNQMGTGMPDVLIIFLSVLVGIVMVMACFNYTNLMIAKSLSRAREIGVRKVVGARRFQVFMQFIGEAVIFAIICLCCSYLVLQLLKPAFMQLSMAREFATVLEEDYFLYGCFLLFAIFVGVIAGALPAGYLSALQPVNVLKDSATLRVYSRLTFRKALIVIQFTLSIVFIIVVLVIYRQINFMVTTDYGINDKNILNVRLQGMEFDRLANELRTIPGVVSVGGVSHRLGTWSDRSSDYSRNRDEEPFVMRDFVVDDNYLTNLGVKFLAGRNFDPSEQGPREKHVILNEQALDLFGFPDPRSAIGQSVYADDTVMLSVIGVVKDFHFRPLSYQIGPVAFRYNPRDLAFTSMRIVPSGKDFIVAAVESTWKKLDPIHPLEWKMMDEEIDDAYTQAGFIDILNIVGYISMLAVTIACLGMLGMAMYATQTRMKEIGVRKVMGASAGIIAMLLSRAFLVLMGIAAVIAVPLGYFFGGQFLDTYAYKIVISPLLVLAGVSIVGGLGLITIFSQTWRAASANPVKTLRYE